MTRRGSLLTLAFTLAASGAFLIGFAVATQDKMGTMDGTHAVPSVNPDLRVRWESFDVSGYTLISPTESDSAGDHEAINLPSGATLYLPVPQPDSLFEKEQKKSST